MALPHHRRRPWTRVGVARDRSAVSPGISAPRNRAETLEPSLASHLLMVSAIELRDRQTGTEVRLATELVAVAGAVREVRDLLREDRGLRDRVDDHERRLSAVERGAG